MKLLFFTSFLLLMSCHTKRVLSPSEMPESELPPIPPADYFSERKCESTNTYSDAERRQMFPFNKTKRVLAIAYQNYEFKDAHNAENTASENTKDYCDRANVLRKWVVDAQKGQTYCAIEAIELNGTQIDSLSNTLLNYTASGGSSFSIVGCYTPRHALLFLDNDEKIIAWIEICFQCSQMKVSYEAAEDVPFDTRCKERRDAIKAFLRKIGIVYGLDI